MRRIPWGLLLAWTLCAVVACGPAPGTAAGWVVRVDSTSITQIDRFVLRTSEGTELDFRVGILELDGGAFPAGHLREHMALAQAVAVGYRDDGGERVAFRLADASWLQQ